MSGLKLAAFECPLRAGKFRDCECHCWRQCDFMSVKKNGIAKEERNILSMIWPIWEETVCNQQAPIGSLYNVHVESHIKQHLGDHALPCQELTGLHQVHQEHRVRKLQAAMRERDSYQQPSIPSRSSVPTQPSLCILLPSACGIMPMSPHGRNIDTIRRKRRKHLSGCQGCVPP